jgi:AAA ATPase domain
LPQIPLVGLSGQSGSRKKIGKGDHCKIAVRYSVKCKRNSTPFTGYPLVPVFINRAQVVAREDGLDVSVIILPLYLGAQVLKGLERPIQIYRVVQPSGMRGRFDVATAAGGLTPFVGREDELRSLMNRWERALEGEGQVALIIGEAGIGKSPLVQRFHE